MAQVVCVVPALVVTLIGVPTSWLWPGVTLGVVSIWEMNQWMDGFCLSLSFCLPENEDTLLNKK